MEGADGERAEIVSADKYQRHVSVSSQSDTEQADLTRERTELSQNVAFEQEELVQIYVQRGVEAGLARQV